MPLFKDVSQELSKLVGTFEEKIFQLIQPTDFLTDFLVNLFSICI